MKVFNTLGVIIIIALIAAASSVYTVKQGHSALLLRLGKIETNSAGQPIVRTPGLHFKLPFVTHLKRFDMRLQTLEYPASRVLTVGQKYLIVDYYAKWKIGDLAQFYVRTKGNFTTAENLLQQQVDASLRAEFGKRTVHEVVSADRVQLMKKLLAEVNVKAKSLGIQVVDVRVKKIDFPEEVSLSVYQRMRTKREGTATMIRAEGTAKAAKIRAEAKGKATVIVATAQREADTIRAQGNATAADIFATAYQQDPKFYAFYRSLQAYQGAFSGTGNVMVLKPSGQFFSYFNQTKDQA